MNTPRPYDDDSRRNMVRHGFGLKAEIMGELEADYHSAIIEVIRENGYRWSVGGLNLHLAKAFGFCYGVDKAIDFAYETRHRFPDRRIFLTNEIIHNPRVNHRLMEMGIRILVGQYADGTTLDQITPQDVVLLPAFGADVHLLDRLRTIGCILVDTTCGSVVHVWKRVERYAQDGFTSIIHGKWSHEETVATCSHVSRFGGQYLVVRDLMEAGEVCRIIMEDSMAGIDTGKYDRASSPGFDFTRGLKKIGIANQTTMLSSESVAIAGLLRQAMLNRYGPDRIEDHFRSFETICNATQERQDAVLELMRAPLDLMLVVGGFNSSNTTHLCEIAARHCPTYHVDGAECLLSPGEIRHKPADGPDRIATTRDWLPTRRPATIGLTAGASTPNRVIGEVIEKLALWESA
ncbi:MAG: 4-hydroxy-3-methylbut-2-enyl diphosphate reductase [bacterium]|nr:4-hydroxy-3-methylbut-2-enyl diphosphate reductase [bacterium]